VNSFGSKSLTVFVGRVGDHNDLGMTGAAAVGAELSHRLGLPAMKVGTSTPSVNANWDVELEFAMSALRAMGARYDSVLSAHLAPVSAISRCAVSLATLPVVASHHPDAVVVWLDAHADLNTPDNSVTGYLGGLALAGAMGLWDSGLGAGLRAGNVVLVGTRDIDPPEQALIDDGTVRLVRVGTDLVADLRAAVGSRPIYFHLDCDVLNPGIVPTDYRVPGGLSLIDLRAVADLLARNPVVGVEIGEFQSSELPGEEPHSPAELLDALAPLIDAAGHA